MSEPPYPYDPEAGYNRPQGPYPGPQGPYGGPQPPPPYGYQGPYQYPQGYNPYGVREHPQGTTVLIMGIVSLVGFFICGLAILLGPVAWIMGNNAIAEIDQNPMMYSNRGQVQAGRVCGIIATVILAIGVFLIAIFIIAASAS